MYDLTGKKCLVTGASRGIGRECAKALSTNGAHVTLLARNEVALVETVKEIRSNGAKADYIACDLTNYEQVIECLADSAFDVLVNSAGIAKHQHFFDVTTQNFQEVMLLNLEAMFFLSQAVAKRMRQQFIQGSIINISSQMGHVGGPQRSLYCASKHAVEGFTKAAALELGEYGIRINTIAPTFIETDLTKESLKDADFRSWVENRIKLGRLAIAEDISGPCVFLASSASAMITGTSIRVDGGWTAG